MESSPTPLIDCHQHVNWLDRDMDGLIRYLDEVGVDCRRENAEQSLRDWHARGARGYGELKWRHPYDSPDAIRLFRLAGELRMPVVVHLQYPTTQQPDIWYGGHLSALERAVRTCPETVFSATPNPGGHTSAAMPIRPRWMSNIRRIRSRPAEKPAGCSRPVPTFMRTFPANRGLTRSRATLRLDGSF